jgi:DNA-binding transcriptional ArsR family regulator
VLQVLYAHGGSMTAGDVAARFSHSWPTTSRHVAKLVAAGLLAVRRDGRERHYELDRERLTRVLGLWLHALALDVAQR